MRLDGTPEIDVAVGRALLDIISAASIHQETQYSAAWRRAALREGVEREEGSAEPVAYAFSPRSTRGATRA